MDSRLITVANGRARIRLYEGGQGPALFYLHGAGGLLPDDRFLAALSRYFRITAPVMPGYEDSEGETHIRTMQDFALHAHDVFMAVNLEDAVVAGHSMGGMIAAEMAAMAPNDFQRLALLAPAGLWLDSHPIPDLFATLPFELPKLLFHDHELGASLLTAGLDLDDPEFLKAFLIQNARRLGHAGKILFPIPERGLAERLYRIRAKTQIIWGENDQLIDPVYATHFADAIIGSGVTMVANAGHMAAYEQPDAVIAALQQLLQ